MSPNIYYFLMVLVIGISTILVLSNVSSLNIFKFTNFLKYIFDKFDHFQKIAYIMIFYVIPLIMGVAIALRHKLTLDEINVLISINAIEIGFLFNLLTILIDKIKQVKMEIEIKKTNLQTHNNDILSYNILKRVFYISAFTILLSVLCVCLSCIATINMTKIMDIFINTIIYAFFINFILSICYILRNFFIVFKYYID